MTPAPNTQSHRILAALQDGRRITALDAWREFGCLRLAARIHDLCRAGHNILAEMVSSGGKRHAVYHLAPPAGQAKLF